jgi:hypothetical protein
MPRLPFDGQPLSLQMQRWNAQPVVPLKENTHANRPNSAVI